MKITEDYLRCLGADCERLQVFSVEWPQGAEVTIENCRRAQDLGLEIRWLAAKAFKPWAWKAMLSMISPVDNSSIAKAFCSIWRECEMTISSNTDIDRYASESDYVSIASEADVADRCRRFAVATLLRNPKWREPGDPDRIRNGYESKVDQIVAGFICEHYVARHLGVEPRPLSGASDGGYDIIFAGKLWDVKTVKRSVDPRGNYSNNVLKRQVRNVAYGYIFCSYNQTTATVFICGWIAKDEFLRAARITKKGDPLPRSDGSVMSAMDDMYDIHNDRIYPIRDLR